MRFLQAMLILVAFASVAAAGPLERAETFRPDVYPCKITAAEGAANRVVDALNGSEDFEEDVATIVLIDDALCPEATQAVVEVLREHFARTNVMLRGSGDPPAVDAGTLVTIRPRATEQSETADVETGAKRTRAAGTVTLTVSGGGVDRAFTTKFQDKCWAADFKNFTTQNPKHPYVLGQTPKFASSEADALAAARQAAAQEIWDPLKDALNARNNGRPDKVMVSETFVRRQVESMLKQGKCVEDTFVQRLDGPNGEVWRASVLVSLSPANIDAMVKQVGQAARGAVAAQNMRRVEQAKGWGSVAAFLAVIVLLYLLVNSLTKGYFVWRLRAAALLLCIVGILVALAVT